MDIRQTAERLVPEPAVRRYLAALALLFAVAVPAGMAARHPTLDALLKTFTEMTGPYEGMGGGSFFLLVLLNNVFASLLLLMSGLLAGVVPVLSVFCNGFFMGALYGHLSGKAGAGAAAAVMELAPHAAFEVPALLVIASYGLWLGVGMVRRVRGKEPEPIGEMVHHAVERYFALAFPLMVAAAAAETFLALRG